MTRATDRFLAEIRKSHHVVSYAVVTSPTGETRRLDITDGSVNVDRTANFRRKASATCIDRTGQLMPDGNSGILTPFGSEVRLYRGLRYDPTDPATEEVMPLGVFRLTDVDITEDVQNGIQFKLDMTDRSWVVSRDKFRTPYVLAAGMAVIDAIKLILGRTFPDLKYDAISSPLTTTGPQVFDTGSDPWNAVYDLATSIGCQVYFNTDGWVVIAPPTDISAMPNPDFTYIEGQGCTMTSLEKKYSATSPGFNGVIVTGQSVGDEKPPVRAEAWDDDPASPTYYQGPYGAVPEFVTDSNVKTAADAQAVADSLLRLHLGVPSTLTLSAWVNPAFEAGDVVRVERPSMNVSGLYAVDAFTVPLKASAAQTVVVRQKQ